MSSIAFVTFSAENGIGTFRWLELFINWDSVLESRALMEVVLLGTDGLSPMFKGRDELSPSDADNAIFNKAWFSVNGVLGEELDCCKLLQRGIVSETLLRIGW